MRMSKRGPLRASRLYGSAYGGRIVSHSDVVVFQPRRDPRLLHRGWAAGSYSTEGCLRVAQHHAGSALTALAHENPAQL